MDTETLRSSQARQGGTLESAQKVREAQENHEKTHESFTRVTGGDGVIIELKTL